MTIDIISEYFRNAFAVLNGFWLFSNIYNTYPFTKRLTKEEKYFESKEELPISLLLPAYKEEKVIIKTIDNIEKTNYSKLEIILITEKDDFKTDRMSEYSSKKYKNIKHVSLENGGKKGKPIALNAGLSVASGGIVGVIDAEDKIERNSLKKVSYEFLKNTYDCIQGILKLKESNGSWLDKQFAAEYEYWYGEYMKRINKSKYIMPFGGTTNFFKKDMLEKLQGWEEGNLTEDYELALRINTGKEKGKYKVGYVNIITYEETPKNLEAWMRQRTRWSQGKINSTVKYLKKKDIKTKDRLKIVATGINSFIGTINIAGAAISSYMYFSGIGMGYTAYVAYLNLSFIGFYSYMQGKSYNKILKEEPQKNRFIKSLFIGITTPAYWILQWTAELRALYREIRKVNNWEKTMHYGTAYLKDKINDEEENAQR